MIKTSNLKILDEIKFNRGVVFSVHFYDEINKKHLDNKGFVYTKTIKGNFDWTLFQCAFDSPEKATEMTVHCGICPQTTGEVVFDNVRIKMLGILL
jgi:hypothetical protein